MRRALRSSLLALWRCRNGASAVEFAMVGPLHLVLIMAMIEAGMLCTRIGLLDQAVMDATKYVYTGTAMGETVTRESLESYICNRLGGFVPDCRENIALELSVIGAFGANVTGSVACRDATLDLDPVVTFDPGVTNSIVFMRVCLKTPVLTPGFGLGLGLAGGGDGRLRLVSATAFANEPF